MCISILISLNALFLLLVEIIPSTSIVSDLAWTLCALARPKDKMIPGDATDRSLLAFHDDSRYS